MNDNTPSRYQGTHEGADGALRLPQSQNSEASRAVAEVQGAIISAKHFPRDLNAAYTRIMKACKIKIIAENSMYEYAKGGAKVSGASIRLAEVLAQNFGNLNFGIKELSRADGESQMLAYCHDLETNTRQTREFAVPHARSSKAKGRVELTDDRDVYELTANQGARRLRACILGIIPADFIEGAIEECYKTLQDADKNIPMGERVRTMLGSFDAQGVTQSMIEKRLGHKLDAISETELVDLRKVYTAIKDGFGSREQYFSFEGASAAPKEGIEDRLPDFQPPKAESPKVDAPSESIKAPPEAKKSAKAAAPKDEKTAKPDYVITFGGNVGKKLSSLNVIELGTLIAQLKSQRAVFETPNAALEELLSESEAYAKTQK